MKMILYMEERSCQPNGLVTPVVRGEKRPHSEKAAKERAPKHLKHRLFGKSSSK